ncbi:hypothetical protein JOB18_012663 [Solea senegalensis]|uniref:Uncharacterized protein n=1 Tax=Solea senegalensis TaxID=28829 RepID=A0AAV6RXJ1_SOLSE|nr:hypothetical protein JOB18_012663 [Solea senegalensis]
MVSISTAREETSKLAATGPKTSSSKTVFVLNWDRLTLRRVRTLRLSQAGSAAVGFTNNASNQENTLALCEKFVWTVHCLRTEIIYDLPSAGEVEENLSFLSGGRGGHQRQQSRKQKSNHPAEAEGRLTATPAETDRPNEAEEDSSDLGRHGRLKIKPLFQRPQANPEELVE